MTETTHNQSDDAGSDGSDKDDLAYADAMAELEEILSQLEGTDVDVDILAEQVQRATQLIGHCRARIEQARLEVEDAVGTLEGVMTSADDGPENPPEGE